MSIAVIFCNQEKRRLEQQAPCFGVRFGTQALPPTQNVVVGVLGVKTKGLHPRKKQWQVVELLRLDDRWARDASPQQKASWQATVEYARQHLLYMDDGFWPGNQVL